MHPGPPSPRRKTLIFILLLTHFFPSKAGRTRRNAESVSAEVQTSPAMLHLAIKHDLQPALCRLHHFMRQKKTQTYFSISAMMDFSSDFGRAEKHFYTFAHLSHTSIKIRTLLARTTSLEGRFHVVSDFGSNLGPHWHPSFIFYPSFAPIFCCLESRQKTNSRKV